MTIFIIFSASFQFSCVQRFTMRGSPTMSLYLLPFVEAIIAATLIALLLRATKLKYLKRRKVNSKEIGIKNICYGLESIPQLKPAYPFIGNFPLLLPIKDAIENALKWCEESGDIWKFCGANETFVLLHSVELIQSLLKSGEFGHLEKSHFVYKPMKPYITNGVLVSQGHFWQGQRKILMKSQSFTNLKCYMGMLNKHGRQLVRDLEKVFKDEQPKPVKFLISRTFLCVISEMITGFDEENKEEMDRYHYNFEVWKGVVIQRICKPWLLLKGIWMWSHLKRKHDKAVEEMFQFAKTRLKKHKADRQKSQIIKVNGDSSSFRSVLDELVDAGVDDDQIVDEVNTMMFGGHETGATSIHFFCLAMALNPEFQAKCREEVNELFEERGEMGLKFDDVQGGLKYLERCILETLRLFPPIFLFVRQLKSPLHLVHKGNNIVLPTGTNVMVTPFGLHRKPEYFPEPTIFNPDRFLSQEISKRSAYTFIPFSAGPRNCLGMKFAMIEMKTIAAYILYNFEITTTDKMEDVSLLPYITTTPERDYIFTFKKRF